MTTAGTGITCSQQFDQNGNPTLGSCTNGSTNTFTVLTTLQICR